jgi:hypothetical protein
VLLAIDLHEDFINEEGIAVTLMLPVHGEWFFSGLVSEC